MLQSFTVRITPNTETLMKKELEFLNGLPEDHWDIENGAYCFDNIYARSGMEAIHNFRRKNPHLTSSSFNFQAFTRA